MNAKTKSLFIYFVILIILCAGFVLGARMMGQSGAYLAGGYMLTPAIAAVITRLFFYDQHFKDANLRFGRLKDYLKYWLYSLGITLLSLALYTLFGAVRWDFSGNTFLQALSQQFAMSGAHGGIASARVYPANDAVALCHWRPDRVQYSAWTDQRVWRGVRAPRVYVPGPAGRPALAQTDTGRAFLVCLAPAAAAGITVRFEWPVLDDDRHPNQPDNRLDLHPYVSLFRFLRNQEHIRPIHRHITLDNAARSFGYFLIVQNQFSANLLQCLAMVLVVA
jgi:hypothetical protein